MATIIIITLVHSIILRWFWIQKDGYNIMACKNKEILHILLSNRESFPPKQFNVHLAEYKLQNKIAHNYIIVRTSSVFYILCIINTPSMHDYTDYPLSLSLPSQKCSLQYLTCIHTLSNPSHYQFNVMDCKNEWHYKNFFFLKYSSIMREWCESLVLLSCPSKGSTTMTFL